MKSKWLNVGILVLSAGFTFAGEISRVADLRTWAKDRKQENLHGSDAADAQWAYYLVNEYGKFHSSGTDRTDWGRAFRSGSFLPLRQSGPERFEMRKIVKNRDGRGFEMYRYDVEKNFMWLYWNKNSDNPVPEIKGAAIVAQFIPARSGSYSIRGKVKWEQYAGAEMKQAAYEIGILRRSGSYMPLFHKTFPKAGKQKEILLLADLSDVKELQNFYLESGDRLCFITAGPRANYRGIKVYDEEVGIVSDALPVRSAGAQEKFLRNLSAAESAELNAEAKKKRLPHLNFTNKNC